jgi:hypothetical protein
VLLGLVWGVWHAPLYAIAGTGQNEMLRSGGSFPFLFVAFVVWTIGLSVLFTWLYKLARGNLLVVILFHAAVNTAVFLPAFFHPVRCGAAVECGADLGGRHSGQPHTAVPAKNRSIICFHICLTSKKQQSISAW